MKRETRWALIGFVVVVLAVGGLIAITDYLGQMYTRSDREGASVAALARADEAWAAGDDEASLVALREAHKAALDGGDLQAGALVAMTAGERCRLTNRNAEALQWDASAVELLVRALGPEDASLVSARVALAESLRRSGRYEEGLALHQRNIEAATRAKNALLVIQARTRRGEFRAAEGDFAAAASEFEEVVRELKAMPSGTDESMRFVLGELGEMRRRAAMIDEARALSDRAWAVTPQSERGGEGVPEVPLRRALVLKASGAVDEANELARQTFARLKEAFAASDRTAAARTAAESARERCVPLLELWDAQMADDARGLEWASYTDSKR